MTKTLLSPHEIQSLKLHKGPPLDRPTPLWSQIGQDAGKKLLEKLIQLYRGTPSNNLDLPLISTNSRRSAILFP